MKRWVRLYTEILHDPKVQTLSDSSFRLLIHCWCFAGQNDGVLPDSASMAWVLRSRPAAVAAQVEKLKRCGLLDETEAGRFKPHGWDERQYESDVSTPRVKRFREQQRNASPNVTGTPLKLPQKQIQSTEAETEQSESAREADFSQSEDPAVQISRWIREYGEYVGAHPPLCPDASACFRITNAMLMAKKNLDDVEAIFQDLIAEKSKPKGMGWVISVLESRLGGPLVERTTTTN